MTPAEAFLLFSLFTTQFEKDFDIKVSATYQIEYKNLDTHAYCGLESNTIVVNLNHFQTLPKRHQKELIYHELGHCELFLRHVTHESIMRPRLYNTKEESRNWPKLLRDMKDLLKNPKNKYKYPPKRP